MSFKEKFIEEVARKFEEWSKTATVEQKNAYAREVNEIYGFELIKEEGVKA